MRALPNVRFAPPKAEKLNASKCFPLFTQQRTFPRTAALRQQRPFHIAHYEASDWGSFNSDFAAARMRPRNMIVRLGSGSARTTRRTHMSEPMFLTLNEVVERYRGQISEGTLRNWRSMRVGPSFLKVGKARSLSP
jgi:hypothetical protein